MHDNIFTPEQHRLLPMLADFSKDFGLIGGTAIALQLGHRRSIDFDLVTFSNLRTEYIRKRVRENYTINSTLVDEQDELTLVVDQVKITFLHYPFRINFEEAFQDFLQMPSLLSLASMKAFTLGRRAKWKDYVDLYFIINKYSFKDVIQKAREIYGNEFNEKLFREQLAYFADIDYSETIDYMPGFEKDSVHIQKTLELISLQK